MDKAPYILGIDPGLTGALAVIDPNMDQVVSLWDMPTEKRDNGRLTIDTVKLAIQLSAFAGDIALAIIENVHSMPNNTHVSAFSFGKATGTVIGMVGMLFIPTMYPEPAVWKGCFGLGQDKEKSRELASKKFPFSTHLWSRKKDHGRAEAVLLADFGKRFY